MNSPRPNSNASKKSTLRSNNDKLDKSHWALITSSGGRAGYLSPSNKVSTRSKGRQSLLSPKNQSPLRVLGSSPKVVDKMKSACSNTKGSMNQLKRLHAAVKSNMKTNNEAKLAKSIEFEGTSWVDRSYPGKVDELFVHKKKVEEVQSWLKGALGLERSYQPASKVCVLTGPCGSGKTATVFVVAKELGVEVKEWINPMSLTENQFDRLAKYEPEEVQQKNQIDTFTNFLFRASQYSSLPIKGRTSLRKRIIVVEDFPNTFYRDTTLFHQIIRSFVDIGSCPVVFIIPDSSSSDSNVYKLFPKNVMQDLNVANISFNSVATSYMLKFLLNVCSKEGVSIDKSTVEEIANASGGDIRCAINTLQFKTLKITQPGGFTFKVPTTKKPARVKGKKEKHDVTNRDETLFLFRALGKVLNAKREESSSTDRTFNENNPVESSPYMRALSLQDNPEDLVNKIEVTGDTFLSFLQQNYLKFFGSIDDIVEASRYLADSEFILSRWKFDDSGSGPKTYKQREAKEEVALLISSRGLMYSNVHKPPSAWRPLVKPMFGDARSRINSSHESVRNLFKQDGCALLQSFFYEHLPYYSIMARRNPRLWSPDQTNFINEIGQFKQNRQRFHQDTLQEGDAFEEESESEHPVSDSQPESPSATATVSSGRADLNEHVLVPACDDQEEDFLIEEYDD